MWTSRIQTIARRTILLCALGVTASGCATSPMDLLPDSARTMIQAEMRLSANFDPQSGPMSVDQMLQNARGAAKPGAGNKITDQMDAADAGNDGLSVAEMLERARVAAQRTTQQPSEEFFITLGTEGVGLNNADVDTYTELLSALSPGVVYQAEIRVGSAGDATSRAVVFKTYADLYKLRQRTKTLRHQLSASMDAGLMAGLVDVRIVRKGADHDA